MSSGTPQILLTGATGYIGGTILSQLLASTHPFIQPATISLLVRGSEQAARLTAAYGNRVRPILFSSLDDSDALTAAASQHDLVINTTLGYHISAGRALVRGLAQRKADNGGRNTWLIHTSGTSNVADRHITGKYVEKDAEREFDDDKDDIYAYEVERERLSPYAQRTAELAVIDAGLEFGVKTLVVMSPTIFGVGTGLFNRTSIQLPAYVGSVLEHGRSVVVEGGTGVWDHVHVQDLAELYEMFVVDIVEKNDQRVPSGKKGIVFSGNGRHSWFEVAQAIADVCKAEGLLKDNKVESVGLAEGAIVFESFIGGADEELIELALSSNSRTVSSVARRLGWKPTRNEEAWKQAFHDDLKAVLAKKA